MSEDRGLELVQRRARLDPELADEQLSRRRVHGQCVGLATRTVEREHELGTKALAERMFPDERVDLGDELRVPSQREIGVDALLENDQAKLLEARYRRLGKSRTDVGERVSSPHP